LESRLFSIIIPTFNRKGVICEALDSIKMQTYRPIEVIVIDDGSTDKTVEVVRQWAEQNKEGEMLVLRYLYQENAGVAAARNLGIQQVKGKYVQFLDSDDTLYPERLQRLAEAFEREQCDFIQTGFEGIDGETGGVIQTLYGRPGKDQVELALQGCLWANTLRSALRRDLVNRIDPWNTDMTCFVDREYMERAVVQAHKPVALREVLASAVRGKGERISNKHKTREGRHWRIFCEERLAAATRNRKDVSYEAKQEFASRLYALGSRSNARGWRDLGKRCGELAKHVGVELDSLGKRRRMILRLGKWGGVFYELLHNSKTQAQLTDL
jgi:glycosyltransferase involved in cell wall biosynthesis